MNNLSPQQLKSLVDILGKFKDLKRSGWKRRGVVSPESDADHSFSVALLALLLAPSHLNRCRCIELALIHDLAEIYCGDILPPTLPSKTLAELTPQEIERTLSKSELEEKATKQLISDLNSPYLQKLITEYELNETPESLFVHNLDKLDNVFSARYYDDNNRAPENLFDEFSENATDRIRKSTSTEKSRLLEIIDLLGMKN